MPTIKKKRPRRKFFQRLTDDKKHKLLYGFLLTGMEDFENEEEELQAWELHKDKLLKEYIADNPGSRPDAWYKYDIGKPIEKCLRKIGEASYYNPDRKLIFYPIFEEEYEFLARSNFLLPNEKPPRGFPQKLLTRERLMKSHRQTLKGLPRQLKIVKKKI